MPSLISVMLIGQLFSQITPFPWPQPSYVVLGSALFGSGLHHSGSVPHHVGLPGAPPPQLEPMLAR